MPQTEKNNIFLSAWYNAVYDFMMVDSVRDDGTPLDSIPIFHFFANIMMEVYPDNTIFKNLTLEERQKKFIVVSPDAGGAKRTLALAKHMKLNTIIMHKQRDYSKPNYVEKTIIIHDTSNKAFGKKAIICDDIADTCGTLVSAINELVKFGFEDIICVITHGIFSNNAIEKINNCKYISKFIVSDSIPQVENCKKCPKLEVFSIISFRSYAKLILSPVK